MTVDALREWNAWNDEIATGRDLPPGMTRADRVFVNNGHLTLSDEAELPIFERQSLASGGPTQLATNDPGDAALAAAQGRGHCIDPFGRARRGLNNVGLVDTMGGTAVADKACRFALHKAQGLGVKFTLGAEAGRLEALAYDDGGGGRRVAGIKTRDGRLHAARLVILACGGWTPSLLPRLDGLCETTAGSVALLRIPGSSSLYGRLAPENFPSWTFNMRHGAEGGLYGFARDDDGWLKIGYRGTKYTNPVVHADGKERSTPVTRWSEEEKITTIPQQALGVIRRFIAENLPELVDEGIDVSVTRMCWYTDTFDNHFLIDYVPETAESLMVVTGGSGHAFKYLPNIGQWVVDIMEGKAADKPVANLWRWRTLGSNEKPANILMEGSSGTRALKNITLADEKILNRATSARL